MESSKYLVNVLTEQDKLFLRNKTVATLPDNPSDKRFSASQIKIKTYEGYLILFEWLRRLIGQINVVNQNFNQVIEQIIEYQSNPITVEETEYVIPPEDR